MRINTLIAVTRQPSAHHCITTRMTTGIALFTTTLLLLTGYAIGQENQWIGTTGPFQSASQWSLNHVPTASEKAVFGSGSYTVNWNNASGNHTVQELLVSNQTGSSIIFKNQDSAAHTVSVVGSNSLTDLSFDADLQVEGVTLHSQGGAQLVDGTYTKLTLGNASALSGPNTLLRVDGGAGFQIDGKLHAYDNVTMTTSGGSATIGLDSGNQGHVQLEGGNTSWTIADNLDLGEQISQAAFTLASGASTTAKNLHVGVNSGNNTVLISDADTKLKLNEYLVVGQRAKGQNILTVENQASVEAELGIQIGQHAAQTGAYSNEIHVEQGTLTTGGSLYVGYLSNGYLGVNAAGQVTSTNFGVVGNHAGKTGVVDVEGENSRWTVLGSTSSTYGDMYFGVSGAAQVNVKDSGNVNNQNSLVAIQAGSSAVVTVETNGLWRNDGTMTLGQSGNATVNVQNGGRLISDGNAFLGKNAGSGTVVVTGTGSTWESKHNVYAGGSNNAKGGSGSLTVGDGGAVTVTDMLKLWDNGTVNLETGGTLIVGQFDHTAGTYNNTGGTLRVTNSIEGDFNHSAGVLAPGSSPGFATINGDYTQGSAASLEIELGGFLLGDEHDHLRVEGDMSLAGQLNVSTIDGFVLTYNNSFLVSEVVGARTGTFDGLSEGSTVGTFDGVELFITYGAGNGNDIALFTAVPEPASAGWAGMLMLGWFAGRRRRRGQE